MRLRKRILYGDIASPIRWALRRQENLRVLLGEVEAIEAGPHSPASRRWRCGRAAHAARGILRRIRGEPTTRFTYHDKGSMAIIGRGSAIADLGWTQFAGVPAWFAWLFIHILMLIGFRNRLAVLFQWAMSYITYQRSVRLITNTDQAVDR